MTVTARPTAVAPAAPAPNGALLSPLAPGGRLGTGLEGDPARPFESVAAAPSGSAAPVSFPRPVVIGRPIVQRARMDVTRTGAPPAPPVGAVPGLVPTQSTPVVQRSPADGVPEPASEAAQPQPAGAAAGPDLGRMADELYERIVRRFESELDRKGL